MIDAIKSLVDFQGCKTIFNWSHWSLEKDSLAELIYSNLQQNISFRQTLKNVENIVT